MLGRFGTQKGSKMGAFWDLSWGRKALRSRLGRPWEGEGAGEGHKANAKAKALRGEGQRGGGGPDCGEVTLSRE
jgi:hypothetical protein